MRVIDRVQKKSRLITILLNDYINYHERYGSTKFQTSTKTKFSDHYFIFDNYGSVETLLPCASKYMSDSLKAVFNNCLELSRTELDRTYSLTYLINAIDSFFRSLFKRANVNVELNSLSDYFLISDKFSYYTSPYIPYTFKTIISIKYATRLFRVYTKVFITNYLDTMNNTIDRDKNKSIIHYTMNVIEGLAIHLG